MTGLSDARVNFSIPSADQSDLVGRHHNGKGAESSFSFLHSQSECTISCPCSNGSTPGPKQQTLLCNHVALSLPLQIAHPLFIFLKTLSMQLIMMCGQKRIGTRDIKWLLSNNPIYHKRGKIKWRNSTQKCFPSYIAPSFFLEATPVIGKKK